VIGQSRGWLFTLPLVVLAATAVVRDRLRVAAAAVLPIVGVLVPLDRLLAVFKGQSGRDLNSAAMSAGHRALEVCAVVFVLGTVAAWGEQLIPAPSLTAAARRRLGTGVAALALALALTGAFAATHGDPFGFVKRQWHGFRHEASPNPGVSHFAAVGSGRDDFWRVSLDAFVAHPLGGLGQDNFADYYLPRRRTAEQPQWAHSLELQQLASTGAVGFALLAAFLTAAAWAAVPALRRGSAATAALAGAALLPSIVWVVHGSVDWFWEIPALATPALGFLGMAVRLGSAGQERTVVAIPRFVGRIAGPVVLVAAVAALGFPYLSVRHVSIASDAAARDPVAALAELATAADLNPWNPEPGRLAGTMALQAGRFSEAERRFHQAISREPGGWYAWLGDGLAASALGDRARASRDFNVAESINDRQPVLRDALARVYGLHPLTFAEATHALAGAY
jgi:tetratricopeptide (TPR) repeat protein